MSSPTTEWQIGRPFTSLDDAYHSIATASHVLRGNLFVKKRNAKCLHLICRAKDCGFDAYVAYIKKVGCPVLRRYCPDHTCVGVLQQSRGSLNSSAFVEQKVRSDMTVTRDTTPAQVIAWYKDHHPGPIEYYTAMRVLGRIRGDVAVQQSLEFGFLPSYCQRILAADPLAIVKLKQVNGRFSSLFIAPSASRMAWPHLRPFIAVDTAFTKVVHDYVLLIATGLDANNKALNLAWGVAPKENLDHWGWFFDNLALALPSLNQQSTVIMSDRQKGLNRAVQTRLPNVTKAYCCKHIERNLKERYGEEIASGYWMTVKAKSKEEFDIAMAGLKGLNERCAEHLHGIAHHFWANYAFPAPRYGQHTSNLVEQQNWVYLQAREKPILEMFGDIWDDVQGKVFRRHQKALQVGTHLSPCATEQFREAEKAARLYNARISSINAATVRRRQNFNEEYEVRLWNLPSQSGGSCSCSHFENQRLPCQHALAFIHELRVQPLDYVAPFWTTNALISTYQIPLPPVLRNHLHFDETMIPPARKERRGRPQKKRHERGTLPSQSLPSTAEPLPPAGGSTQPSSTAPVKIQGTGVWGGKWRYVERVDREPSPVDLSAGRQLRSHR